MPISTTELRYWDAYRRVKHEMEQEANEQAQSKASSSSNNPGETVIVTMGQQN